MNTLSPLRLGPYVFWDPERYAPDDIEAVRPDGVRLRPVLLVMLVSGRRLAFEEGLPEGTEIFQHGTLMWVVRPGGAAGPLD